MTKTGEAARPPMELDAESLLDMLQSKQREILIGVLVVAAAVFGFWVYRSSVQSKENRGSIALSGAAGAFYSGNKALAKVDLAKVAEGFKGTPAGVEASMMLAQILFEEGKYDEGIKRLQAARAGSGADAFVASLESLMGEGYLDLKKYDDASKHYLVAADKTPFAADKDIYQADAARAYTLGGKPEEAKKLWLILAEKPDSPVRGEAHIRLGELQASAPAKK